jgi:Alpha galactosidase A/Alpha galactosidase C-terminal beta sandwich domain
LYFEEQDAQSFAEWEIDFIKVDNCAQYALGNTRYQAFADAVNRTGRPLVISTEPFSITPTPRQGAFSNLYRTTNDIEASYSSSMNRADLNANWLPLAGPGAWADPDCLMCGHGGVNEAECRSIFAVWAVSKAPLLIGAVIQNLTAETLATLKNPGVLAISDDPLGIPGRKLAANSGRVSPFHVGLAPCTITNTERGVNGVTAADLLWAPRQLNNATYALVHQVSGRCLATRPYMKRLGQVPVLLPCDESDATQSWLLPQPLTLTHVINAKLNLSLAAGESTVWGAPHGKDNLTLLDAAYGITNLTFEATTTEPPCTDRSCDGYEPRQSWFWSQKTGQLSLALFSSNNYRCFEGSAGCYDFSSHAPTVDDFCLSRVLAISNDGLDTDVGGVHAWGGPLAGGDYVIVLENRDGQDAPHAEARWSWLEAPGVGDGSTFCVTELYSNQSLGNFTGGIELPVPSHDAVVLRMTPCGSPNQRVTRLPASAFSLSPADRWSAKATVNGTIFESKWGGASAVASSLVNATAPPYPTAIGLLFGTGSSNGYMRVSLNGAEVATLNTFSAVTSLVNEQVIQLKGLPNHPLWVLGVEATGTWQSGSKDSFIEVVGVNVYY